jgi:hypothetical protein
MTIYGELSDAIEHGLARWITRWAYDILDEVASGHRVVRGVRHPLGFLCLPVYRMRDEGVCIHVWGRRWPHASLTTSPAHCHSWDLLSWVLAGELHNQIVRVIDDPDSATHRVFVVDSSAAGDEIRATGRLVRHEIELTSTHRAGQRYRLPAGVFHQTLVPDDEELVATIALGRGRPGALDRSLGGLGTGDHQVRRESCDARDTVALAAAVRDAVAPSGTLSLQRNG